MSNYVGRLALRFVSGVRTAFEFLVLGQVRVTVAMLCSVGPRAAALGFEPVQALMRIGDECVFKTRLAWTADLVRATLSIHPPVPGVDCMIVAVETSTGDGWMPAPVSECLAGSEIRITVRRYR